jgi:hypothetical protein
VARKASSSLNPGRRNALDDELTRSGQKLILTASAVTVYSSQFSEPTAAISSWEMMYFDQPRGAIVVRLARQPAGPWGNPMPVATSQQYPTLYGGFLHPDSHGSDIYFTMTQYDRYNVSLMHVTLPTNEKNNAQAS